MVTAGQAVVCHLFEVQCDSDPVKLPPVLDAGTLPPPVGPIDCICDWMSLWKQTQPWSVQETVAMAP